jgi:hypothetical protein
MQRVNLFVATLLALAGVQFSETGLPGLSAELDLSTGVPARVYLFKDDRPFRLSPVDALLPLHVDFFYRERLWRRLPSPATLEVTANEQSHFFLLRGRARFVLPPGKYRVEAYRGFLHKPAFQEARVLPERLRPSSVTNGPLVELTVNGQEPGAVLDAPKAEGRARVVFHRPIEKLEIIANGQVVATREGDGAATELTLPFAVDTSDSTWIAARASSPKFENEPDVRAHTNPVYVLRGGRAVRVEAARRAVLAQWEREAEYSRTGGLSFADDSQRQELLEKVDTALGALRR